MKNVFLYMVFLLMGYTGFGQGVDVIFVVDNTTSVVESEYLEIQTTVQQLMNSTLECNPGNRVTVMQFTSGQTYLESNFSSTIFSFPRRWNNCCYGMPQSLVSLSDALNGIVNPAVQSPIKTLTPTFGNKLVLYFFTDAGRGVDLLIGNPPIGVSNNSGFVNYTNFKNNHNAKFFVAIKPPDIDALKAAASIASVGGNYNSGIEPYMADPDGAGQLPRYLFNASSFLLSVSQLDNITDYICNIGCVPDLVLISPDHNVTSGQDNRQAKFTITASNTISTVAVYHAGITVVLKSGFHGANGSKFRGYIEGCTNIFEGLIATEEEQSSMMAMQEEKDLFTLSPNPSADRTVIASDKMIAHVEVKSLTGTIFYSAKVNDKSHELYIGNYPKGFYMVMVTTDTGEVEVKKLIKD